MINGCFLLKTKWGRPSSGTAPLYINKNSSTGFSAPAMPILEFTEIGRYHPPPQLLFVRMFRPISLPKGQI